MPPQKIVTHADFFVCEPATSKVRVDTYPSLDMLNAKTMDTFPTTHEHSQLIQCTLEDLFSHREPLHDGHYLHHEANK